MVVGIVVGILTTIWAVHRADRLAVASGQMDKPQPQLFIGGAQAGEDVKVYFGAPFDEKTLTVIQLPILIRNEGQKTTKGVELIVREPQLVAIENDFLKAEVETILPISVTTQRHFTKSARYVYVSLSLPDMHPGQGFMFSEPIKAFNSEIETHGTAVSKDAYPSLIR